MRRLLLAAFLSMLVLIAWQAIFPPQPQTPPTAPVEEGEPGPGEVAVPIPEEPERPPEAEPGPERAAEPPVEEILEEIQASMEETVTVRTESYEAELTNRGAQLRSFRLKEHPNATGGNVDMVRARAGELYPFGLVLPDGAPSPLNEALFVVERSVDDLGREVLTFRYGGPEGRATKRFAFGGAGLFELELELPGFRGESLVLGPGIRNPSEKELKSRFARKSGIYRAGDEVEKVDAGGAEEITAVAGPGLRWVGLQDTYFLAALVPQDPVSQVTFEPVLAEVAGEGVPSRFRPLPPEEELSDEDEDLVRELLLLVRPAGERLALVSYWGAKEYERLADQPYGLEKTVDLGFFGFLTLPLLYGLRWIYANVVSNYGWAIILMTVLIRILLFPLTHKSVVSMQKMQELNPKMQAIRQKYRAKLKDKQGRPNPEMQRKMNEEIMALYKKEGVNPAGGCLPMLLQIPVLFAFYSLLSIAIELRHAPWMLWVKDLSAPDPYLVLPIVMGASQFLQQKLTPSSADPMQRRVFMLMPFFFTILFLGFPSGLVLYWLTNNVLGIVQQVAYNRLKQRKAAAAAPEKKATRSESAKKKAKGK